MQVEEFRRCGKEMVDYVADYWASLEQKRSLSNVEPGYLRKSIPEEAPEEPEKWEDVLRDVDRVIMPGVTHWHSPHFHAYFPTGNSYPAICADILSNGIACIGFTWVSSPACTELEIVMMDWLGRLLNLPDFFLASSGGKGGGIIQGTASEATYVALLAAKSRTVLKLRQKSTRQDDIGICDKLVAYCSSEAHSSVERAALLGMVKIRLLPTDNECSLRGATLKDAIEEDKAKRLIPFMVITTLGTTSSLAFDNIMEIGPIAQKEGLWMHIDAAYAGAAFICPEFRPLLNGVEYADSFNFNPHKWMMVNFDCSAMWVRNSDDLISPFMVNPVYLQHEKQAEIPDFRHWQIPLGRRFRSLKLWFVLRMFGARQLREHIRNQVALAHQFESYVRSDNRFEITSPVIMGLVCFRVKGTNEINGELTKRINDAGKIHLVSTTVKNVYMLRFVVCSTLTTAEHVKFAWDEILHHVDLLSQMQNGTIN